MKHRSFEAPFLSSRTCSILTERQISTVIRAIRREDRTVDFTFTEEQLAAAEAARGVFAGVAPDAVPSPALTTGAVAEDFDRTLWSRLADADLLSLLLD